jgi:hypothetical protein
MIIFFINYDKNNNIYNINNYIKNFKDDYNINNNIFDMNILNYKRKNNIYNTHYYINTHVGGRGRIRTRAPPGYGATIANRAVCQDSSARWRLGRPLALKPPKCHVEHWVMENGPIILGPRQDPIVLGSSSYT